MRVDRVFALLIESGLIYCCVWVRPTSRRVNAATEVLTIVLQILYWISTFGALPNPGLTVIAFVSVSNAHVLLLHILSVIEC